MGFHLLDWVIIIIVGLLIFGPKALQSLSHGAGRGIGHLGRAKDKLLEVKDELVGDLPIEEIKEVSQMPRTPQQAAKKMVSSALSSPTTEKDTLPTAETEATSTSTPTKG